MSDTPVAILAGGLSHRMGTDKGFLELNGKPIIEHLIDVANSISDDVFIVSDHPQYARLNTICIQDIYPDHGPVGGIYTALEHVGEGSVLVLSCDIPLVDKTTLQYLLKRHDGQAITVPQHEERLHPLMAVYPQLCREEFKLRLRSNELRLLDAVRALPHEVIEFDEHSTAYNPDAFININTPESYDQLLAKFR